MALAKDVEYLLQFVDSLGVPILRENLDELQQTVHLMQADNTDEFYDISTRNKKYGRVDAINGPILLEKCVYPWPKSPERPITNCITDLHAQFRVREKLISSQHFPQGSARSLETFKIGWLEISLAD